MFVNEEVKTEEGNPVSSNLGAIIAVAGRYYLSQSFLCVHTAMPDRGPSINNVNPTEKGGTKMAVLGKDEYSKSSLAADVWGNRKSVGSEIRGN